MRTTWSGQYYGGETATREDVSITVSPAGLRVDRADGSSLWWRYDELTQTQGFHRGEPVRLERGDGLTGGALVVADSAFLAAIHALAPEAAGRFQSPATRARRLLRIAAAGAAAVLVAAALYLWAIPRLADRVAARVPVSWEEQLGASVVDQLTAGASRCESPEVTAAVQAIVDRLAEAAPGAPYRFRVTVINRDLINAFAAPGGFVVVNRGLLKKTARPEELAGVLAHEMEHVLLKHGTKAILREVPTRLLLAAMAGDASGLRHATGALGTLGVLRYQRRDEDAADRQGMALLQRAGVDPQGMIAMFRTLQREAADAPEGLSYLSSHPQTAVRIARLSDEAAAWSGTSRPLLPETHWSDIAAACSKTRR